MHVRKAVRHILDLETDGQERQVADLRASRQIGGQALRLIGDEPNARIGEDRPNTLYPAYSVGERASDQRQASRFGLT